MARRGPSGCSPGSTRSCRGTPTWSRCCPSRCAASSVCRSSCVAAASRPAPRSGDPRPAGGHGRRPSTAASFSDVGAGGDLAAWRAFGRAHRRARRPPLPDDDRAPDLRRRRPARCSARTTGATWSSDPIGEVVDATFDSDLVRGDRAHRRAHRDVRLHARRGAGEPLLPLPRDRRGNRGLGRAGRRDGRRRGGARGCGTRLGYGPADALDRHEHRPRWTSPSSRGHVDRRRRRRAPRGRSVRARRLRARPSSTGSSATHRPPPRPKARSSRSTWC